MVSRDRDVITLLVGKTTKEVLMSQSFRHTFGITVMSHEAPITQGILMSNYYCVPHTHFILSHSHTSKNLKKKKLCKNKKRYSKGLAEGWGCGPMVEYSSGMSKDLHLIPRTTKSLKQNNHPNQPTKHPGRG